MADRLTLKDPYTELRVFSGRLLLAAVLMVLMFAGLAWRYYDLQVRQHEQYRTASERNRVQLLPVPPKRGLIFDRNGILLAENIPSYRLTLVVEEVANLDATFAALRELVDLEEDDERRFRQRMHRRRPFEPVPLRFRLSEEDIAILAVNRHRLPGVDVDAQLVRHYPQGQLFAHVLGYVGRITEDDQRRIDTVNYSGTDHIGRIGIERFYEHVLHGSVGHENVEANARGRVLRVLERSDPVPGQDIVLHLDAGLQRVAAEVLAGQRGAVVAIDPANGGVLALVSTPSFDPNLFVNGISRGDYHQLRSDVDLPLFNRALQGQYPPGSTVKPMFALAGLHHGVITPQTRVRDPGWFQLPGDDRFYRDWRRQGHAPWVDLNMAIAESCDVYFYDMAHRLGIDRLHDFSVQFGFGQMTGIDTTSERPGLMPSRDWKRRARGQPWFPGETLVVGIGQGYMLSTPLQLAVATAAVASRGDVYTPRLLRSLGDGDMPAELLGRVEVDDSAHWDSVIQGMVDVLHGQRGTARGSARGMGYRMAGKTGTAQVVGIAQGEEYDREAVAARKRPHALFVGYAPVENPRIAVAVIVENGESGGGVAAPIARRVMDAWLERDHGQLAWSEGSP